MNTTPTVVTCEECGQKNRLPLILPVGKKVICGACGEDLVEDEDDDDAEDDNLDDEDDRDDTDD
jgi:hypothetical protein